MGGLLRDVVNPEDGLAELHRAAHGRDIAADVRDDQAKVADRDADARDLVAQRRDDRAARREAVHRDSAVPASRVADSRSALRDREASAGDRISALEDRARARQSRKASRDDRQRAAGDRGAAVDATVIYRKLVEQAEDNAEDMLLIGQAQGILMASHNISAAQALLAVYTRANRDGAGVSEAAQSIIEDRGDPGVGRADTGT
jgi:hypothetical protein